MRWRKLNKSKNVEDRRGSSSGSGFGFPGRGRGRMPMRGGGKLGLWGIVAVVAITYFMGGDIGSLLQGGLLDGSGGGAQMAPSRGSQERNLTKSPTDEMGEMVSYVFGSTDDVWIPIFKRMGKNYRQPTLVLFSGRVRSACGMASSATGPFYCPGDQKVYIDLSFYNDLKGRMGAPGDFAQAYVIAHEVGHHVQTLLGISREVHAARSRSSKIEGNKLSVKQELQADCFAGIWANHVEKKFQIIDAGDVEEAMGAASAVGDDRLQKQAQGYVTPESFTHGTSAQRISWFKRGFTTGDVGQCDTFSNR